MQSRPYQMLLALALVVVPAAAAAQGTPTPTPSPTTTTTGQRYSPATTGLTPNRDVILEVPELSVDSIGLTVNDVKAHVALDANAMNFVQITAGVDVGIKQVQLSLSGVYAEAYLYVDLDNVAKVVNRVVTTLDRNPQILTQLLKTVDTTVNAAAGRSTPP